MKQKAIEIIEYAKSYYLLSKDHWKDNSKPILVGNKIKLEFALEGIDADMVIATSGNDTRCIILMDLTVDECWLLAQKGNRAIMKLKARN